MLSDLHQHLSKAAPVVGIADLGGGEYRIDFAPEATEAQKLAAELALATYQPTPSPDWAQFRAQIAMHGGYLRLATSSPITMVLNTQIVGLMWQLGDHLELLPDVSNLWNALVMATPPTPEEVTAFQTIVSSCNLPFEITAEGLIQIDQDALQLLL